MPDEQDYKIIETKANKHRVKIRNYTTGADQEALSEEGADNMTTVNRVVDGKIVPETEINNALYDRLNRVKIARLVKEVDGRTEDMAARLYEFKTPDFDEVMKYIDDLTYAITMKAIGAKTTDADKKKAKN